MPPKKTKAEAVPKRSVDDVRNEYIPKQERMREEILALKHQIELAGARNHATMVDLELARDRNVLTEGRLESKQEVLADAIESQRRKIEEASEKAQTLKGDAHIKNIRVQMLQKEHDEFAAHRKIPEKQLKAEQLRKDLDGFFAKNPNVAAFIRDRDDAMAKEAVYEEAVSVYKTVVKGMESEKKDGWVAKTLQRASIVSAGTASTGVSVGQSLNTSDIAAATAAANHHNHKKLIPSSAIGFGEDKAAAEAAADVPHVDPAVLLALDEEIQTYSKRIAEKQSKTIDRVKRTKAMLSAIELRDKAALLTRKEMAKEAQLSRQLSDGQQLAAADFDSISQHGCYSSVVGRNVIESDSATRSAPLQLTFIHGGASLNHNNYNLNSSSKALASALSSFSSSASASSAQVTNFTSPCLELVRTLQLDCGFVLRREVVMRTAQVGTTQNTRKEGREEAEECKTTEASNDESKGGERSSSSSNSPATSTSTSTHLARTMLQAIRTAVCSPASPTAVPLVVIEGYVKTRRGGNRKGPKEGRQEKTNNEEEELVVMCDPACDADDAQSVVPLNTILCEVMSAAPRGWDQATLVLELAPADDITQGIGIVCHRGSYVNITFGGSASATGGNNSGSTSTTRAFNDALGSASVVFQYHKLPTIIQRLMEDATRGVAVKATTPTTTPPSEAKDEVEEQPQLQQPSPPPLPSLSSPPCCHLIGGKAGVASHCGLLAALITYLIRDSATPTAAIDAGSVIAALRGALDSPSAHALFAGIGKVVRPLQQRANGLLSTILSLPPQLVAASARNPHRLLVSSDVLPRSDEAAGGGGHLSTKATSAKKLFVLQQQSSSSPLVIPSSSASHSSGSVSKTATDSSKPRPWLCAARAEGNKSVFERIRRRTRESLAAAEAAAIAKLLAKPKINYAKDVFPLGPKVAAAVAAAAQQNSGSGAAKGSSSSSSSVLLPNSVAPPPTPPFDPFSVFHIPVLLTQASTSIELRNRLCAELVSREERMVYLRNNAGDVTFNDADAAASSSSVSSASSSLVTWISKRTMEDARHHVMTTTKMNNNANANGQGGAAAATAAVSPLDAESSPTTTTAMLTSFSRAKLLATVAAARGRSAPEIHVGGAFLTSDDGGGDDDANNNEKRGDEETSPRTSLHPILLPSLHDGGGILRVVLTRKDLSTLPSVAGVALFDDIAATEALIARLYREAIAKPVAQMLGLPSLGADHHHNGNGGGRSSSSSGTSPRFFPPTADEDELMYLRCSLIEAGGGGNKNETPSDDQKKKKGTAINDNDASETDSVEAKGKKGNDNANTASTASAAAALAPKAVGKATLLAAVTEAESGGGGVYLISVKVPLTLPKHTRERVFADFLAALSAACRDPRPLTEEEEEELLLVKQREEQQQLQRARRNSNAPPTNSSVNAPINPISSSSFPSPSSLANAPFGGGGSDVIIHHRRPSSANNNNSNTLQHHLQKQNTYLACEQPWVFLHKVTISTRDPLGAVLVQQTLRESIAFEQLVVQHQRAMMLTMTRKNRSGEKQFAQDNVREGSHPMPPSAAGLPPRPPSSALTRPPIASTSHPHAATTTIAHNISNNNDNESDTNTTHILEMSRPQSAAVGGEEPPTALEGGASHDGISNHNNNISVIHEHDLHSSGSRKPSLPANAEDKIADDEVDAILSGATKEEKQYDADDFED